MIATAPDGQVKINRLVFISAFTAGFAVLAAQIVGAFVGLDASGFWADELVTVWIVDTPDWPTAWDHILKDVHPPVYSLALRAWSSAFGLNEVGLRSFSAACASLAVAVLLFGPRQQLPLRARLLAATLAVSSSFWLEQSQNARMYGLGMLEGSILAVLLLTQHDRLSSERLRFQDYVALLAVSIAAALTHHYLFLASGAVYAMLIMTARRWTDRLLLAACGLIVLVCAVKFMRTMLSHTMFNIHETWFRNDVPTFLRAIRHGYGLQFGKAPTAFILLTAAVVAIRGPALWRTEGGRQTLGKLALLAIPPIFLIVGGVAVSLLVAPSFSDRNIAVAAPWAWLFAGGLYELALSSFPQSWRSWLFCLLIAASAVGGRDLLDRGVPVREEWRNSGAYISGFDRCSAKPTPIVYPGGGRSTPEMRTAIRYLYRHYLEGGRLRALPVIDSFEGPVYEIPRDAAKIMAARIRREDPCPVLMWVVHGRQDDERMIAAIREATGIEDASMVVRHFPHYRLDRRVWEVQARVVVATPRRLASR